MSSPTHLDAPVVPAAPDPAGDASDRDATRPLAVGPAVAPPVGGRRRAWLPEAVGIGSARDERSGSVGGGVRVPMAIRALQPLLATAGVLEFDDDAGWRELRQWAHATVAGLIEAGLLPPHLRIELDEPPVVVARTLTAAWRRATRAAADRHHRC